MRTLSNKVCVVRSRPAARRRGMIGKDIDNNITVSDPDFHALENACDKATAERLGLDWDFFTRVRKGDVHAFENAFDLAYTIIVVVHAMGLDWSVEKCQSETEVYLQGILERERQVRLYPGVPEALAETRKVYPQHSLMAHTDCPLWLAIHRLDLAGILVHFDSLAAVHLGCPAEVRDSRFASVVEWVDAWLAARLNQAPAHLECLVGLPKSLAKPNPTGPLTVLEVGGYDRGGRFVMFDDKPSKGGCLRDNLRSQGVDAYFVHTKIGKHDPVLPDGPQADGEVLSDYRESLPVLARLL